MPTPTVSRDPRSQAGARALGGKHPKGFGALWWLALLLLALVVAALVSAAFTHKSTSNGGTVTVNGIDLVGNDAPSGAQLAPHANQQVTGNQAHIVRDAGPPQKIGNGPTTNDDERFFVGSDAHQILAVVGTGAELPQALPPGHRITFTGTLKAYNGDPNSIGLDPQFSSKVAAEGYYIDIDPASVHVQS